MASWLLAPSNYRLQAEVELYAPGPGAKPERWIIVTSGSADRARELFVKLARVPGVKRVTLEHRGRLYSAEEIHEL